MRWEHFTTALSLALCAGAMPAFAEGETPSSSRSEEAQVAALSSSALPSNEIAQAPSDDIDTPFRAPRVASELGLGLAGGAVAALPGMLVGTLVGSMFPPPAYWEGPSLGMSFGLYGGYLVGVGVGIHIAGSLFDGHGVWWATALGELSGTGAALLLYRSPTANWTLPALFLGLPLAGGALAYELSNWLFPRASSKPNRQRDFGPVITVAPTLDGGVSLRSAWAL
jgi:hypothetical protein